MRPRPSPAVLSALVTGESLERLRRGLAAGTGNLDSPTESTDQLLAPEGGRGREALNLEETDLDLLRGGCEADHRRPCGGQLEHKWMVGACCLRTLVGWGYSWRTSRRSC